MKSANDYKKAKLEDEILTYENCNNNWFDAIYFPNTKNYYLLINMIPILILFFFPLCTTIDHCSLYLLLALLSSIVDILTNIILIYKNNNYKIDYSQRIFAVYALIFFSGYLSNYVSFQSISFWASFIVGLILLIFLSSPYCLYNQKWLEIYASINIFFTLLNIVLFGLSIYYLSSFDFNVNLINIYIYVLSALISVIVCMTSTQFSYDCFISHNDFFGYIFILLMLVSIGYFIYSLYMHYSGNDTIYDRFVYSKTMWSIFTIILAFINVNYIVNNHFIDSKSFSNIFTLLFYFNFISCFYLLLLMINKYSIYMLYLIVLAVIFIFTEKNNSKFEYGDSESWNKKITQFLICSWIFWLKCTVDTFIDY